MCQAENGRNPFCIMYRRVEINKDRPNMTINEVCDPLTIK